MDVTESQINELKEEPARTFNVKAIIFYLHNIHNHYSLKEDVSNVPIYGLDKKTLIGFANIHQSGDKLIADLSIEYSSPERLEIETMSSKIYVEMGYHAELIKDSPLPVVHSLEVLGLCLVNRPNNAKLDPLGTPVL